jgi:hypothetical protein
MRSPRIPLAWLGATLATAATGSIAQTQFNLAAIRAAGATVPFDLRLQATLQDLAGFAPLLAGIAAAALLVGFVIAAPLVRRWPGHRNGLFTLAGALAVTTAILLMNALLPLTVIGATRSLPGLVALGASGALGGRVYARLARAPGRRGMA